jgi:hypothetical protein
MNRSHGSQNTRHWIHPCRTLKKGSPATESEIIMEFQDSYLPNFLLPSWNWIVEILKNPAWSGVEVIGSIVIVILIKIFLSGKRRRSRPKNLRFQLWNELELIEEEVKNHSSLGPSFINKECLQDLAECSKKFEKIFHQTHILTRQERMALASLLNKLLDYVRTEPPVLRTQIRELSGLLEKAIAEFRTRLPKAFLKRKDIKS